MTDMETAEKRQVGLTKLFKAVIYGNRQLKCLADGHRFLEALCAQKDVSKCVETVIAAPGGLTSIAKAFRFSGDCAFLNGPGTSTLRYLSDPSIKQLYSGHYLHRILEQVVQPPTYWNTLIEAHHARLLTDSATHAFAWLLLELLCCRSEELPDVREVTQQITDNESLTGSEVLEVRNLGHKIKHILVNTSIDANDEGPGGRHDNDFVDYRKVKILPTSDEFASAERPFYRRADAIESAALGQRGSLHLDNQFRLLREDLVGELREDYQTAIGAKKGRRKAVLRNLEFVGIDCGIESRRKPCSVKFRCNNDIPQMQHLKTAASRHRYIVNNKTMLKHQSLGCLISDDSLVAFATIDRDEKELAKDPPVLLLCIADEASFSKALSTSKLSADLRFIQVDTAAFAYEPILSCLQDMVEIPLQDQLLDLTHDSSEVLSGIQPTSIINDINKNRDNDLQDILRTTGSVKLDNAQAKSLLAGLSKRLSLIQGPPGTGKSFIGALIAKVLHDHTSESILVLTYTNHALDQYLVDLQDIGIPAHSMVRLGMKSNASTQALRLFEQQSTHKMTRDTYRMIQECKSQTEDYHDALVRKMDEFNISRVSDRAVLRHLEFSDDSEFFDAFQIPSSNDGMRYVGSGGGGINELYLLKRWANGKDAGVFRAFNAGQFTNVWTMEPSIRRSRKDRWIKDIVEERVSEINNLMQDYNRCQNRVQQLFRQKQMDILGQKRIVGCTTTAAAMYTRELQHASPSIIIVEEAGEILESHILTAMTRCTQQLILIGDHKQLRPKVSNYSLSVEKGDGYNLNQSLFERLVLAGVPHTTLNRQHRMRPEISTLVRSLNYPELEDAPKTEGRPPLRGFQNSVIFVSHDVPELSAISISEHRDGGAKSSKTNDYEAGMVLKCVRYLGQQGYGTNDIVILTPYLGQLYLLAQTLSEDNDPVLNDLDSFELIRAGLVTPAGANISKRKLKISTIDNYQGEESDIVIATLTRSNAECDIGFMAAPQRLNVLLSRARNALIMIGNAHTFMNSRKGREVWVPLMDQLKRNGHIYDGFPIQCEQHPDKKALLTTKDAFDTVCPDGGCSELCGVLLNCEMHNCPQRCHQLQDHSKMNCEAILSTKCPQNHKISRYCYDKAATSCQTCQAEAHAQKKKRKREWELDQERQAKQRTYAAKLAELDEEVERVKRIGKDQQDEKDRQIALAQKKQDLANLKERMVKSRHTSQAPRTESPAPKAAGSHGSRAEGSAQPQAFVPSTTDNVPDDPIPSTASAIPDTELLKWDKSEAKDDWVWQKKYEGVENEALDSLMGMIGLESVKQRFIAIKTKVDTLVRQDAPLKGERFGAVLLGNPGTGKTTVARLYAKFLVHVGALPGDEFLESSGSSLANDGVSACKDHISKILGAGGGVFFIDEAYQLVSGNSHGGKAVLDFLLAEIENLTGKIVFVLAGYHKQMEAFFEHNPGIPSRIPIQMEFQDYNDQELQRIFCHYVDSKYKGRMKIEDGMGGLFVRIAARRIGRGRGRDGFGNAREVQNKLSQVAERQAKRLRKERRAGKTPDDHWLTKEDLIGLEPSSVLRNNVAWNKLQKLIGLSSVKDCVRILLDGIQYNYQRELEEKPLVQYSLNRCFIGSPGTGKTSVAKLYGRILADIGLLSNGEVIVKNPADFVGDVLGASESKTKGILASTLGKVLIIDEAYMLASGGGSDIYKGAVIDTIVAEVQSTPGEDRCVLLLGYKDQMEEMMRDVNPGLARRFPLDSAFAFEDFTDNELRQILDLKLNDVAYNATDQAKRVAMETLQRARNKPNFGNAGEIDIVLDRAKALHQKHMTAGKAKHRDILEAFDFDPDFDRGERAATNLPQLFQDVVGCSKLIEQFQRYQTTAANMKALGMDPREQIPFNFLFKGPPGTGKTTTAQKMGKVFYDMGLIGQAKVEECSATDMIGQYVGQTGPKVQKLLEKALGKVLFIDEAYRLAGGGFATEAMDELVDCLTKPRFAQKLVTVLAGYDKDIDRLMSINPGLTSRFPESVIFPHLSPDDCLALLRKDLHKKAKGVSIDLSVFTTTSSFLNNVLEIFQALSKLDSWGNARDVKSLAKTMFGKLISEATPPVASLVLREEVVLEIMETVLDERSRRNEAVGTSRFPMCKPPVTAPRLQNPTPPKPALPKVSTQSTPKTIDKRASPPPTEDGPPTETKELPTNDEPEWVDSIFNVKRDSNVSNAVWEQLERDKHAAVAREREYIRAQEEKRQEVQRIEELKRAEQAAKNDEEKRRWEQERIEAELERRRNEERLAKLERMRQEEIRARKKLRELGPCPMGYHWIKQSGGYRCAGGSHWLSESQV